MKTKIINAVIAGMMVLTILSCKEDDKYTVENKTVSGTMSYVRTDMVILESDPSGNPITIQLSFSGSGTITDIGEVTMVTTFKFSYITFMGYDFEGTYTLANSSDHFAATGYSQLEPDFTGVITEMVLNGTGKFENIIGGGETAVVLDPIAGTGTGTINWTITY